MLCAPLLPRQLTPEPFGGSNYEVWNTTQGGRLPSCGHILYCCLSATAPDLFLFLGSCWVTTVNCGGVVSSSHKLFTPLFQNLKKCMQTEAKRCIYSLYLRYLPKLQTVCLCGTFHYYSLVHYYSSAQISIPTFYSGEKRRC